jgi:hypothetical protein
MRSLMRRIERLERGSAHSNEGGLQMVLMRAGTELALDTQRCVEILRQSGRLKTGPYVSLIQLGHFPPGLNAEELEQHLREHGDEICRCQESR